MDKNPHTVDPLLSLLQPDATPSNGTSTAEPALLIQRLALSLQTLACLRWLNEFQILSCIPYDVPVSYEDLAELAAVPQDHLRIVCRLLISLGLLTEHPPQHLNHTSVSYAFVTQLSLSDSLVFITETLAPTSLGMIEASKSVGTSNRSAYNVAFESKLSFTEQAQRQVRLPFQAASFFHCIATEERISLADLLRGVNEKSPKDGLTVDVAATSLEVARTLATIHPNMQLVVQLPKQVESPEEWASTSGPSNELSLLLQTRVKCQRRPISGLQPIRNASTYILHIPFDQGQDAMQCSNHAQSIATQLSRELQAHADILHSNRDAVFVILATMVPGGEETSRSVDSKARLAQISLFQLTKCQCVELQDLRWLINSTLETIHGLIVTREITFATSASLAIEISSVIA